MTDNQLLILAFVLFWVTLVILAIFSTNRLRTIAISLSIHLVYASFLLHGLVYRSQFGSGLVWWFYLLLLLGLHILVNVTLIVINISRQVKRDAKVKN